MTTLKNYSMVLAALLCLMPPSWAFEFSLGQTEDVKHPDGIVGEVNWRRGISIEGLVSERTQRMSLRKGTALLARDSQYLYLGVISELPNATETKLTSSDRVFFNVTSPTGKEVAVELNSNGEGCLSAGMLQTFKSQKGNYHHFIALPWHCFGISAPEAGSIWKIQMGRLFQSPNERALLNLKRPALVRMEDGVPALDFKVGKSSWTTGYFPQMVWKIRNLSPQTMEIEGKAEITWIGNPILFHKKENLAVGAATEFSQLLSGGSENDLRTCNMEFQFNGKPFFRRTIDMGGAGIAWQTAGAEATQFRIGVYPSLDTVKACVSNRNPDQLKDFDSAVFQVVDDQGKRYCESMVQKEKGVFYSVWHLPRLKTGKYYVTGTLLGERGKAEPLVRQPFEYRRFEWENNAIGLDRIVIPPFKPLAVDRLNKRVNATMTGYAFGRKLLDSVTSEGKELLTTPVAFSVNGKELSLEELDFIDTAPDRVRLAGSGTVGPLKVKIHYDIDYDGLVWVTMDLDSGNWTLIHSMSLEIPMKSEYARFLHATCAQTRKHPNIALADKEGVVFSSRTDAPNNFLSYIWYGGFSKGLCWCTETEKEWSYSPDSAVSEVIRGRNGATVLRVNMINRPTVKRGVFSLAMGFQATPVKPVMPKASKYATIQVMSGWTSPKALRVTPCVNGPGKGMKPAPETAFYNAKKFDTTSWEPYDYSIVRMLKKRNLDKTQRDGIIADYIEKYLKEFSAGTRDRYRALLDHAATCYTRNNDKLLYYFNPRSALLAWDAYRVFQDEWYAGDYRSNYEGMYSAEPVRSYQDYIMPILREYARNGLDGIYYDCTYESASIDKVMFPDADTRSGRRLFMNMRQLVKRTATMLYLEGRLIEDRPFVEVHISNCAIIPMMSFASHSLGWEVRYGDKDYQQRFDEAYLASESIGVQAGVVSNLLIDCRDNPERLQKTALAVTLPYGLLNHTLTGGNPTEEYKNVLDILDRFGYRNEEIEIFTCYDPANPVVSADRRVKLMTLKMASQYLLCIGNTGDGGELDLDLTCLKFPNPCAVDVISKKEIGVSQRLSGEMPYHGYRLILVANGPQDAQLTLKRINP